VFLLLPVLGTVRFGRVSFTYIAVWGTSFFLTEKGHSTRAYVGAAFSRMNQVAEIRRPSIGK
jgi:hypothetical protein